MVSVIAAAQRRRQWHAGCGELDRGPGGVGAAHQFGVGELHLGRDLAGVECIADDLRGLAGRVAEQPGHLLDGQELVDGRVLVVDARRERAREFFELRHQRVLGRDIFLGEACAALGLGLDELGPELGLCGQQRLVQLAEIGEERFALDDVGRGQELKREGQRRHQRRAQLADVLLDVLVHRDIGSELAAAGRAVGPNVGHRLEHFGRGGRNRDDPVGLLKTAP
ncbi:hypothetical protein ABH974_000070 [Bradyrhizobium ottawaense]